MADCPLDAPRLDSNEHWDLVARLAVSSLHLAMNQCYRGLCQLVFDPRHAARPDELSAAEWAEYCADLYRAQDAVVRAVRPDHINIESLGNVVPHLHWHIIPRFCGDPRWGRPIWQDDPGTMADVRLAPAQRAELIGAIRAGLGA